MGGEPRTAPARVLRFTGERKPIYADLTSLASIDLISRSLRRVPPQRRRRRDGDRRRDAARPRTRRGSPTPEGQRYTAELRMVAVDQKMAMTRNQEG